MNRRMLTLLMAVFAALFVGQAHAGLFDKKEDKKEAKAAAKVVHVPKEGVAHTAEFYWWNSKTGASQWNDPLPVFKDEATGVDYYVDPKTGESTWEKPADYAWKEGFSEDHKTIYYYNEVTKESTWEKPEQLAWEKRKASDNSEL